MMTPTRRLLTLLACCALPWSALHAQQTPFRQDRARPKLRATAIVSVQQISLSPNSTDAIYDQSFEQERANDLFVLQSDMLLGKIIDDYAETLFQFPDFRPMQRAQRIAYLRSCLEIDQAPNSQKISITVANQSGELAATLANAVVTLFKSFKRNSIADPTRSRINALDQGLKAIQNGIQEIAATIAPFSPLTTSQILDLKTPQISEEFLRTPGGCTPLIQALLRELERKSSFQDRRRMEENVLRACDDVVHVLQLASPPVTGL